MFEETGYRVRPGRGLGEVHYLKSSNGRSREKVVRYWAMRAVAGAFTPNREVDELMWVSPDGADALLTRPSDREVLERFAAGPVRTGTVLLVRHASAGDRDKWKGDDRLRPLDETGSDQADELVRLLSRFDVQRLVSADYLRCVQTLQPLADSIGLEIEEQPLLSEEGFPGHEQEAVEAIRELGDHEQAVAVCSQRAVDAGDRRAAGEGGRRRAAGSVSVQEGQRVGAQLRRRPARRGGVLPSARRLAAGQLITPELARISTVAPSSTR